jgi:uncharacterized membrane protein
MIEFMNTIVIERPLKETFAFMSDFENLPKWNYYVLEVKKVSDGPVGVGTLYQQIRKTDQQQFWVVEYEPDKVVTIETLPPERKLRMRFQFKAIEGGKTQIVDEWHLETNKPKLLEWIATNKVRTAVSENLEKLKTVIETGQVKLQDGREMTYHPADPTKNEGRGGKEHIEESDPSVIGSPIS